jgi:hypothetical protein
VKAGCRVLLSALKTVPTVKAPVWRELWSVAGKAVFWDHIYIVTLLEDLNENLGFYQFARWGSDL